MPRNRWCTPAGLATRGNCPRLCALCVDAERVVICLAVARATRATRCACAHRYDVNKDDKVSFEEIVDADSELRKEVKL